MTEPVVFRHHAFGEVPVPISQVDAILRRVRDSLDNERDAEDNPVVRCAVRHMHRSIANLATKGARRGSTPTATRRLHEAVLTLDEFDPRPIEIAYPVVRVRGPRGRTHSRDVVMRALCRLHRIAIPSPPMGIEAVHGDPPRFDRDRPHAAIFGLPDGMPEIRFYSWCWSGEETNVSMRWESGLTYSAKDGFATIGIPRIVPETIMGHLVGRTADAIADVPGFERMVIMSTTSDEDARRTVVEARHDTPMRMAA